VTEWSHFDHKPYVGEALAFYGVASLILQPAGEAKACFASSTTVATPGYSTGGFARVIGLVGRWSRRGDGWIDVALDREVAAHCPKSTGPSTPPSIEGIRPRHASAPEPPLSLSLRCVRLEPTGARGFPVVLCTPQAAPSTSFDEFFRYVSSDVGAPRSLVFGAGKGVRFDASGPSAGGPRTLEEVSLVFDRTRWPPARGAEPVR
jgi:hypothetical protein